MKGKCKSGAITNFLSSANSHMGMGQSAIDLISISLALTFCDDIEIFSRFIVVAKNVIEKLFGEKTVIKPFLIHQ